MSVNCRYLAKFQMLLTIAVVYGSVWDDACRTLVRVMTYILGTFTPTHGYCVHNTRTTEKLCGLIEILGTGGKLPWTLNKLILVVMAICMWCMESEVDEFVLKEVGHTSVVIVCILPIFNSLWHHFGDCYFWYLATQQSFVIETFPKYWFFHGISIDFCEFQPVAKK